MATPFQIQQLRNMIDDTSIAAPQFTDEYLGDLIDLYIDNLDKSAQIVWEQKAAQLTTAIDTSESGSSRSASGLYRNAAAQAVYYRDKSSETVLPTSRPSTTRSIERI